jgi:hypothetical protein
VEEKEVVHRVGQGFFIYFVLSFHPEAAVVVGQLVLSTEVNFSFGARLPFLIEQGV